MQSRLGRRWPVPVWGNMRRAEPFSDSYGTDRGTPVDRHFLRRFLERHRSDIRGTVMEMERPEWVECFGVEVDRLDIVDINPANLEANRVLDLCEPDLLPNATYDCMLVTQTLQYVASPASVLRNLGAALAPGGTLFLSVPVISRLDANSGPTGDRWRFSPAGLRLLLEDTLPGVRAEVVGFGNLPAALAFLAGLAAEELSARDLELQDERFPIIACARVTLT